MARRTLLITTWLSGGLFIIMVVLAIASVWINPWSHHLSLTSDFHAGVWGRGWDIRLVFFNDTDYGPYRGSMIGVFDDQGNIHPPLRKDVRFGDTAGVYYRYFRWADATLWTLMVMIWYPIVVFSVLLACVWLHYVLCRARRLPPPHEQP